MASLALPRGWQMPRPDEEGGSGAEWAWASEVVAPRPSRPVKRPGWRIDSFGRSALCSDVYIGVRSAEGT